MESDFFVAQEEKDHGPDRRTSFCTNSLAFNTNTISFVSVKKTLRWRWRQRGGRETKDNRGERVLSPKNMKET